MLPASEFLPYVPAITGIPLATVRNVYRELHEDGLMPFSHGRGNARARLDSKHIAYLILGLLADVPLRSVAKAARTYYDLENAVGKKAGDVIALYIDSFRSESTALIALHAHTSRFELDCTTPRIRVIAATAEHGTKAEAIYGKQSEPWKDARVRKTLAISGIVLHDLAIGLHFNRWPASNNKFLETSV